MKKYTLLLILVIIGVLITPLSAVAVGQNISQGATVFLGEENLNISAAAGSSAYIGWWAIAADISSASPNYRIPVSNPFYITPSEFSTRLSTWYRLTPNDASTGTPAFNVANPYIELQLYNKDTHERITTTKITSGTNITFKIITNMYTASSRVAPTEEKKGYIHIRVVANNGATYTKLVGSDVSLENIFVNSSEYYWDGVWDTDGKINGVYAYNSDEYTIYAESDLNGVKIISSSQKLSTMDDVLSMSISTSSIARGNSFTVTIVGKPLHEYNLSVTKPISSSSETIIQPVIRESQEGVTGNKIKTKADGTRLVSFLTNLSTSSKKFTIRIEDILDTTKFDEVEISIIKGGMTIVASTDGTSYTGETITLSGTNTESQITYLFIYGPNLNVEGAQIEGEDLNPRSEPVINNDASTFEQVIVEGDGTWEWEWHTYNIPLDVGTYTIFAVSQPKSKSHLIDTAYATTSVNLKKPTLSATISQPSVAKGDVLFINGFAEGDPSEVAIWIMGKNYAYRYVSSVDGGSEFSYEITRSMTDNMASGQYYVIIQHPMQNKKFDIILNSDGSITNLALGNESEGGTKIFQFSGSGSLQGTDAAAALIDAINDH